MDEDKETCGMVWEKSPDDIQAGHIEYEALTKCGEYTCSDECYKQWAFCPYCGKKFDYYELQNIVTNFNTKEIIDFSRI